MISVMISFKLKDKSQVVAFPFFRKYKSVYISPNSKSLGGVESLVNHPVTIIHASILKAKRLKNRNY